MRAKRRLARILGLQGRVLWVEIEALVTMRLQDLDRAARNLRELQTFLEQVQLISYEQGVSDLLGDVETAIAARSATLPVPILAHLTVLAQHHRDCPLR